MSNFVLSRRLDNEDEIEKNEALREGLIPSAEVTPCQDKGCAVRRSLNKPVRRMGDNSDDMPVRRLDRGDMAIQRNINRDYIPVRRGLNGRGDMDRMSSRLNGNIMSPRRRLNNNQFPRQPRLDDKVVPRQLRLDEEVLPRRTQLLTQNRLDDEYPRRTQLLTQNRLENEMLTNDEYPRRTPLLTQNRLENEMLTDDEYPRQVLPRRTLLDRERNRLLKQTSPRRIDLDNESVNERRRRLMGSPNIEGKIKIKFKLPGQNMIIEKKFDSADRFETLVNEIKGELNDESGLIFLKPKEKELVVIKNNLKDTISECGITDDMTLCVAKY